MRPGAHPAHANAPPATLFQPNATPNRPERRTSLLSSMVKIGDSSISRRLPRRGGCVPVERKRSHTPRDGATIGFINNTFPQEWWGSNPRPTDYEQARNGPRLGLLPSDLAKRLSFARVK